MLKNLWIWKLRKMNYSLLSYLDLFETAPQTLSHIYYGATPKTRVYGASLLVLSQLHHSVSIRVCRAIIVWLETMECIKNWSRAVLKKLEINCIKGYLAKR
jgi:hypothetical protein